MRRLLQLLVQLLGLIAALAAFGPAEASAAAERRIALVVGEAAYPAQALATSANDAGLIAQTLQAAGFDVTGARDLEEEPFKRAFRDFLDKVAAAGPEAVAFVYFAGYGLQLEGENYLVPVDAAIRRDADIPLRALRVSDYLKPLAASGAKLSIVVLDAARATPFQMSGAPLAGGLALFEPGPNALLAFNAAPGTVAAQEAGPYGAYAHALAEMMRDGGRPLGEVFEQVRLRVADGTKGAQIPWNSAPPNTPFVFFERTAGAPPPAAGEAALRARPLAELGPDDGFAAALRRDTLQGYQDYLALYPAAPPAKRVRAILAARREALTWRRARAADTPNAYWTYLRRYPRGPHAYDARRRLAQFGGELEPPASFVMADYDVPPPPPEEIVYVERPVIVFDDPAWGFAPPPPPPVYYLPPPPLDFVILPPPIIVAAPYVLPVPVYTPVPIWQRPPAYVAPPPDNVIFRNIHNTVAVDQDTNGLVIRNPGGRAVPLAAGAAAGAAAIGAALPAFMARRPGAAEPDARGGPPVPGALRQAPVLQGGPGLAPAPAAPPALGRSPLAPPRGEKALPPAAAPAQALPPAKGDDLMTPSAPRTRAVSPETPGLRRGRAAIPATPKPAGRELAPRPALPDAAETPAAPRGAGLPAPAVAEPPESGLKARRLRGRAAPAFRRAAPDAAPTIAPPREAQQPRPAVRLPQDSARGRRSAPGPEPMGGPPPISHWGDGPAGGAPRLRAAPRAMRPPPAEEGWAPRRAPAPRGGDFAPPGVRLQREEAPAASAPPAMRLPQAPAVRQFPPQMREPPVSRAPAAQQAPLPSGQGRGALRPGGSPFGRAPAGLPQGW